MTAERSLIYASATDRGLIRTTNQDTLFAGSIAGMTGIAPEAPLTLLLVADGMGGYQGGDVASALAVSEFSRGLSICSDSWPAPDNSEAWLELLSNLVHRANTAILEAQEKSEFHSMGTTLTAAVECSGRLHLAHVGDSRLYHYANGHLYQATSDHSLVGELLRRGQLTEAEARVHPQRNVMSQALGAAWHITIETRSMELSLDSRILLCSDGLSNMLSDAEIAEVLGRAEEPERQVGEFIDRANRHGGKDNVSVIIACYQRSEEGIER